MRATLVLEDGTTLVGKSFGATGRTSGEVVFNTGMTGYQEILTDPSYAGQIVCLTYPIVGNYGINEDDFESRRVQVEGFVVREAARHPSNWRNAGTLHEFLRERGIVGIEEVDTRALTRALRARGVMMGAISTEDTAEELLERVRALPSYSGFDFARKVTTAEPYEWKADGEERFHVALIDCGVKFNIMRCLATLGCRTTVFPCTAPPESILERKPDGIMLSPGPGDPSHLGYVVETVRALVGKAPMMGVCLGTQLLGYAFGCRCFKLRFGHRGSNHPVRDTETDRVYITSQNHGYAVDPAGLQGGMEVAHINLNDGTVEGLRHRELPVFSIQYHPEASPGPRDSGYFFTRFVALMERGGS
ncbi:MAG TPA: glutamine-hydrolyzing carbamoyl-phosphate synthase small subunit [Chthonomonadales bacterium]|nr:glutamine-hydrolyzing carbamoyl-phosphate synthase small subunit [Chthonomonadales bacterium]